MSELEQLRTALSKISEIAGTAVPNGGIDYRDNNSNPSSAPGICTPKSLPQSLLAAAAKTATDINPVNAPLIGPIAQLGPDMAAGLVSDPLRIAVLTAKYWGPTPRTLTVSFMEATPADLRNRIILHMNAWAQKCGISFKYTTGTGQVRISREGDGFWSYLGTDILHIAKSHQTMNLQEFTMNTPESEYHRVVRHETGHTLGFPHEHMRKELVARIDPQKAYAYFLRTQGWDKATVDAQVLTALDDKSILGTPPDQTSIMCYQLPASITKDGKPITGGLDINATDYAFSAKIYPKPGSAPIEQNTYEDESAFVETPDYEFTS